MIVDAEAYHCGTDAICDTRLCSRSLHTRIAVLSELIGFHRLQARLGWTRRKLYILYDGRYS